MRKALSFVLIAATALLAGACGGSSPTTAATPPSALPHQMKGYELYSWQTGDTWNFALLSGTNSLKSIDQITAFPDAVTAAGSVKVSAQGVDAVKTLLERLPANESVSWIGRQARVQWYAEPGPLMLPPNAMVDTITAWCRQLGVNLQVVP